MFSHLQQSVNLEDHDDRYILRDYSGDYVARADYSDDGQYTSDYRNMSIAATRIC